MFTQKVSECIEDESKRYLLEKAPVLIIASQEFKETPLLWEIWKRENRN